jgi:hypothetical protein
MKKLLYMMVPALLVALGCSSPAKVEVRPDPLVLEGKDATGQLRAVIFDENGKALGEGYSVTWMCLDSQTIKVQQDGTVTALSSGKALVDVEVVGTEIHGTGNIEVKIPSWVEVSGDSLALVRGKGPATVWAEVRDDKGFPMKGYLPAWKTDDPKIVSIEAGQNADRSRSFLNVTPLAAGQTYLTASYKDLAADIQVTVAPEGAVASEDQP